MKLTEVKLKELIEEALSESIKIKGPQHQNVKRPWLQKIVPALEEWVKKNYPSIKTQHRKGAEGTKFVLKAPGGFKDFDIEVVWDRKLYGVQVQYQGGSGRVFLQMKHFSMEEYIQAIFEAIKVRMGRWG